MVSEKQESHGTDPVKVKTRRGNDILQVLVITVKSPLG